MPGPSTKSKKAAVKMQGYDAKLQVKRDILTRLSTAVNAAEFHSAEDEFNRIPAFAVSGLHPRQASILKAQNDDLDKQIRNCISNTQFPASNNSGNNNNNANNDQALKDAIQQSLAGVTDALNIANQKILVLQQKGQTGYEKANLAAAAAVNICTELTRLCNEYAELKMNKKDFEAATQQVLDKNQPDMQQVSTHRGYKQILVDIASVFLLLFAGYAAAAAYKRSFTIFPVGTDTQNKLLAVGKAIHEAPEVPVAQAVI
ncbi:MAG: hypothetical protein EPN84_06625 [Legionella sp.]|nr:MAG: hypothetical protein EPN84_06625 [Legionella sp.]